METPKITTDIHTYRLGLPGRGPLKYGWGGSGAKNTENSGLSRILLVRKAGSDDSCIRLVYISSYCEISN